MPANRLAAALSITSQAWVGGFELSLSFRMMGVVMQNGMFENTL
jgi:hypothetical protein